MRVAIVNDLALPREVLKRLVLGVPGYVVAWTAENGAEAVRKAAADRPDVILMDLVMPVLDGVEATRQIMTATPCPILLVTSSVSGNFNLVYSAMGAGALDAVDTPTVGVDGVVDGAALLSRLAKLARASAVSRPPYPTPTAAGPTADGTGLPLVALGASTGGPEAVAQVLEGLPATLPAAVVVVQHIAAEFAPSLANWLQGRTALSVRLAREGDPPRAGEVLVAGTNDHLLLRADRRVGYGVEPADYPYRPSVDVFFDRLRAFWPQPGVAALLTGMGCDGAAGLLRLRQAGWLTLAQDRATCVVYGMPKAAEDLKAASRHLPPPQIAVAIVDHVTRLRRATSDARDTGP